MECELGFRLVNASSNMVVDFSCGVEERHPLDRLLLFDGLSVSSWYQKGYHLSMHDAPKDSLKTSLHKNPSSRSSIASAGLK
jgi:hypothetical protein